LKIFRRRRSPWVRISLLPVAEEREKWASTAEACYFEPIPIVAPPLAGRLTARETLTRFS
jgi:hypothetical protein